MEPEKRFNVNSILKLRNDNNLSVPEFAKMVGVHPNNAHQWEKGLVKPSITTLKKNNEHFSGRRRIFF